MREKYCTAVLLAGGQGRRMEAGVCKQYLDIGGKPLLYYSLCAFEQSGVIDDVVLVVGEDQEDYVQKEIIEKYGFQKVACIVRGGNERYQSVWAGLRAIRDRNLPVYEKNGLIFVHDSARPCLEEGILERAYEGAVKYRACAVGMPSKDTVKLVDAQQFAVNTPDREQVWIVQTPQTFDISLIIEAYSRLMREQCIQVTDDAMVVEKEIGIPVKMVQGSYRNIKVTTPEDLGVAEIFLNCGEDSDGVSMNGR